MQPSTTASRRATWSECARELVADLQRARRGEGGQAWRIAYLAGAGLTEAADGALMLKLARKRPHQENVVTVPSDGPATQQLVDAIAWHMDQDSRTGDMDDEERGRLPAGTLLADPLLALLLADAGMDEIDLRNECEALLEEEAMRRRRTLRLRLRRGACVREADIGFHMNEVRAAIDLPGELPARWWNGHLRIETQDRPIPHTLMTAMRGHRLAGIVDHPLIARAGDIAITAATSDQDHIAIATDASTRLVPIAPRIKALAA